MFFPKDSVVEVSYKEEGFTGARFEATVISPPSPPSLSKKKKNKKKGCIVFVQYKTLVADEGSSEPLREFVDLSLLRPQPPQVSQESFELNEVVDAFHEDGWWTGFVNGVLDQSSYCVLFQNPSDQIQFTSSQLRPHLEWIDGKWIRPEKKRIEELIFGIGAAVEVTPFGESFDDAWLPANVLEKNGDNSILVEYQSSKNSDVDECLKGTKDISHIRPPPPGLQNQNYVSLDKVDAFFDSHWCSGVITKHLPCKRYIVFFRDISRDKEFSHSELRPHMEWKDGKWFSGQALLSTSGYREQARHVFQNGNKREMGIQNGSSGTEGDNLKEKISNSVSSVKAHTEHSSFYDERSPSRVDTSSKKKLNEDGSLSRRCKHSKEGNVAEVPSSLCDYPSNAESPMQEMQTERKQATGGGPESEKTNLCGMRRRPRKSTVKHPQDSGTDRSAKTDLAVKEIDMPVVGLQFQRMGTSEKNLNLKLIGVQKRRSKIPVRRKSMESTWEKNGPLLKLIKRGRGRRPKSEMKSSKSLEAGKRRHADDVVMKDCKTNTAETGNQLDKDSPQKIKIGSMTMSVTSTGKQLGDSQDSIIGKPTEIFEAGSEAKAQKAVAVTSCSLSDDDRPLSMWLEDMHTSARDNSIRQSDGTVSQVDVMKEIRDEIVTQTPAVGATIDNTRVENRSSCIVKRSPLWKMIEAMEAFQLLPQNPHFRPLAECIEEFREGLAIGNMVAFTSTVEKAFKLQMEDPRCTFDSMLVALGELELQGFDVKPVQCRVHELVSLKSKWEQLFERSKRVGSQIAECHQKKAKTDEEIDEIEREVKELEEKRLKMMVAQDSEMGSLQSDMDAIQEEILHTQLDFKRRAASF